MSHPFQCGIGDYQKIERMLGESLTGAGVSVDVVQCPRGSDERTILAMRDHAVAFNQKMQITVADVNWHPGAGLGCE
ncbi:hypothetical protein SAMN05443249_1268 [Beijerinckia sp. 28-YEA-48]|nr:hypothetical protein SAMN05443249_1268 [Beijerinckia sp. 28-YEA-48]